MSGTKTEIILSDTLQNAKKGIESFIETNKHKIQSVVNIVPHVDLKGSEFGIKLIYIPKEDAE